MLIKQGNHNEAYKKLIAVSDYKDAKKYLEKFCALPVKIISECSSAATVIYNFSYDKNGRISDATSNRFCDNVYSFDKNGRVAKATHESSYTTYTYKSDGTVLVEKINDKGKRISADLFNSYGNNIAYYSSTCPYN